jgi:sirohydrochlorin cobaltochelatase
VKSLISEQDTDKRSLALLLAAHGERKDGAVNYGIVRLADALRGRQVVQEIAVGFIKGTPTITESARALRAREIIVYPLFLSDGYFTRTRLPEMLNEALRADRPRTIRMLPPIGLDPAVVPLLIEKLVSTAESRCWAPWQVSVIFLAHGSTKDPASRTAAERIATSVALRGTFRTTRVALLEEPPALRQATSGLAGPIIVFGLFAGEGMHGTGDAPRLVQELGRPDAVFAGTLAELEGVADLVAAAVARAIQQKEGALIP